MSSVGYHEPVEELSNETRDMHRAIVSLMEELEAVDWYNQRADACKDPELKAILEHNRDEEKEHAAMVLEWIRRRDATFDKELRDTLFTDKYLSNADAVLSMYHDQGLPVLKFKGFGRASNITLGLPIIRTSVDHGTALDLAATGKADCGSLYHPIATAQQMASCFRGQPTPLAD